MITYEWLYILAGIFFAIWALLSVLDRSNGKRWGNAAFWGLLAASFLLGSHIGDFANGVRSRVASSSRFWTSALAVNELCSMDLRASSRARETSSSWR